MTLNLDDYRVQVPYIKMFLDNKTDWVFEKTVGTLALATSTHIVAISCFIGELYGFTPNIVAKIKSDAKFYKINKIVGLKESIDLL